MQSYISEPEQFYEYKEVSCLRITSEEPNKDNRQNQDEQDTMEQLQPNRL